MAYVSLHIFDTEDGLVYAVETNTPAEVVGSAEETWHAAKNSHKGSTVMLAQLHEFCKKYNLPLHKIAAPRDPVHMRDLQMRLILNDFDSSTSD